MNGDEYYDAVVRVDEDAHSILKELRDKHGISMAFFTSEAVKERYERLFGGKNEPNTSE